MTPKLSDDQRRAIRDHQGGPIAVEDDETRQEYVLVDRGLHEKAMSALQRQEDLAAIHASIDDMEAGRVVAFEEVDARIRAKLGMLVS